MVPPVTCPGARGWAWIRRGERGASKPRGAEGGREGRGGEKVGGRLAVRREQAEGARAAIVGGWRRLEAAGRSDGLSSATAYRDWAAVVGGTSSYAARGRANL